VIREIGKSFELWGKINVVWNSSAAQKAGLNPDDIILQVNEHEYIK